MKKRRDMKILNSYLSLVFAACFISVMPIPLHAQAVNSQSDLQNSSEGEAAIDGYCPVCIMKGDLVKGNSKYSATYKGKKYLFDTSEDKKMFLENPELYTQGLDLK